MAPHQVAVGVNKAGGQKLSAGIRLALEQHPEWVLLTLDISNFFNEMRQDTLLRRVAAHPTL